MKIGLYTGEAARKAASRIGQTTLCFPGECLEDITRDRRGGEHGAKGRLFSQTKDI